MAEPVSVLFVCLGNICRSPMAEGVFRNLTNFNTPEQHPLISRIDSCGTGAYHSGDGPDPRTMSVLAENGLKGYKHQARKIQPEDFADFDYVIAMDASNLADLKAFGRRSKKVDADGWERKVRLFGEFGGQDKREEVGDPYYGGRDGFEIAYEQVTRCGQGLLKEIEERGVK
ncbi:related to LTP1-protein-tyrosine-phosphatase [Ramularia collo-cygni]|uniref:Related to LTP1-protein-tyrosine-phosphatase n=1 Tax=Ramularia collo-cygni TaxID=112498 RepID=A0A2D3VJN5_9PEZI|nr:related to LTP1-protein-tyrosine-phosphatase [Ramularia collo-cygni]CZT21153.1 related to LTP1-protein-tyrosine-phosphatase [Ramularia collo-cygni]